MEPAYMKDQSSTKFSKLVGFFPCTAKIMLHVKFQQHTTAGMQSLLKSENVVAFST